MQDVMLSRQERETIQALLTGGVPAAAAVLGVSQAKAEMWVAELMWYGDGRAYLARLLDARAVGLMAPKAMATVTDLMEPNHAGRVRLAAAQLALQAVGLLRPGVDTGAAARAAQQAADGAAAGVNLGGLSGAELLAKVELIEQQIADEKAPPGETPPGGW